MRQGQSATMYQLALAGSHAGGYRSMTSCWDDLTANFLELSGHDHQSSDDLYELVAKGAGGLAISSQQHVHRPEVQPRAPPSEDEMAGWLHSIIQQGQGCTGPATVDRVTPAKEPNKQLTDKKLPTMENNLAGDIPRDPRARRKTGGGGGGARRINYAVAHSQTEKRRRSKINESLKALKQLVPGCDKLSNQASTLDQTIQYIKSLQHQVQAMCVSVHCSMRQVPLSPGVHVRPALVLGAPPPMVPFAPIIPSVMMPATMIYRPAAAPDFAHARWLSSGHIS